MTALAKYGQKNIVICRKSLKSKRDIYLEYQLVNRGFYVNKRIQILYHSLSVSFFCNHQWPPIKCPAPENARGKGDDSSIVFFVLLLNSLVIKSIICFLG